MGYHLKSQEPQYRCFHFESSYGRNVGNADYKELKEIKFSFLLCDGMPFIPNFTTICQSVTPTIMLGTERAVIRQQRPRIIPVTVSPQYTFISTLKILKASAWTAPFYCCCDGWSSLNAVLMHVLLHCAWIMKLSQDRSCPWWSGQGRRQTRTTEQRSYGGTHLSCQGHLLSPTLQLHGLPLFNL